MTQPSHHSPSVFSGAIERLSTIELTRLKKAAQFASRRLAEWSWEDLLHEAVRRAIEGSRAWPTYVPLQTFLVQTMRSLSQEQWEREHRRGSREGWRQQPGSAATNPEPLEAARQELEEMCSWFAADPAALAIVDGMGNGDAPNEIKRRAGLDTLGYRAAQKRIRRIIGKHLKEEG